MTDVLTPNHRPTLANPGGAGLHAACRDCTWSAPVPRRFDWRKVGDWALVVQLHHAAHPLPPAAQLVLL